VGDDDDDDADDDDDDERQFFSFKYMASESGSRILGLTWTNHD